jgi:hypothetical protein
LSGKPTNALRCKKRLSFFLKEKNNKLSDNNYVKKQVFLSKIFGRNTKNIFYYGKPVIRNLNIRKLNLRRRK